MEDGITGIVSGLRDFGVDFDEGMMSQTEEKGDYGPYQQSRRGPIYQAFCKELVKRGLAYPCFCTEEDLAAIRKQQEAEKALPGYHTTYARCRGLTMEQVEENIKAGSYFLSRPFVMATKGEISEQNELVQALFDYVYSAEGDDLIKSVGLITTK